MRDQVRGAIDDLERHGYRLAALVTDCAYSSDGIFTDPVGYMQGVVEEVHAAGGVYIADEVQSGFARLGDSMWGFSRHGVVPDIVTMGKPMGNGVPISGCGVPPRGLRGVRAQRALLQHLRRQLDPGGRRRRGAGRLRGGERAAARSARTARLCAPGSRRSHTTRRTSPKCAAAVCTSVWRS